MTQGNAIADWWSREGRSLVVEFVGAIAIGEVVGAIAGWWVGGVGRCERWCGIVRGDRCGGDCESDRWLLEFWGAIAGCGVVGAIAS